MRDIEFQELDVMYATASGTWQNISKTAAVAFARLEAAASPRGRKMLGYWCPSALEYRACYARWDGDDARALDLMTDTIPRGYYRTMRLKAHAVFAQIPSAFDLLASAGPVANDGRPWLEIYRRHDELDLLVPISNPPT